MNLRTEYLTRLAADWYDLQFCWLLLDALIRNRGVKTLPGSFYSDD